MPDLGIDEWPEKVNEHLRTSSQPLIAIVGPTAGGKTGFSINVAEYISTGHTVETPGAGVSLTSNNQETPQRGVSTSTDQGHIPRTWHAAEIINADSRQLYRHLDIGTAKVTEEERRGVPHHLIDVLDPTEEATI